MPQYDLLDYKPLKRPRLASSPRKGSGQDCMSDIVSPPSRKLFCSPCGSPDLTFAATVRSPLSDLDVNIKRMGGRKRSHNGKTAACDKLLPITHYFRQLKLPKGKSNLCPAESVTKSVTGLLNNLALAEPSFSPLTVGPPSILPTVENADIGLPSIDPQVLAELLVHGPHRYALQSLVIVDCRYSYEHQGGHVRGALNITNPQQMEQFLLGGGGQLDGSKSAIILYCEFSSERAPRMFKHIRNEDRKKHLAEYPKLTFPHMYVMKGGYKAFVKSRPELCIPTGAYVPMLDKRFSEHLAAEHAKGREVWDLKRCRRMMLTSSP